MSDATRDEVIQWARTNLCDFIVPKFPPPTGWMWAERDKYLVLTPVFTNIQDADITPEDVWP